MLTISGGSKRVQKHTTLQCCIHLLFVNGDSISARSSAFLVEPRLQSVGIDPSATFHAVQQSKSAWGLLVRIVTSLESQSVIQSRGTVEQFSTSNHQAISRNDWRPERAAHLHAVGSVLLL